MPPTSFGEFRQVSPLLWFCTQTKGPLRMPATCKPAPSLFTLLGALALVLVVASSCGSRYVPVHSAVASMHRADAPECSDVRVTRGPGSVSRTAYVHIDACGKQSSYICSTQTVPAQDAAAWARTKCARTGTLRAYEIVRAERRRQDVESGKSIPRPSDDNRYKPPVVSPPPPEQPAPAPAR